MMSPSSVSAVISSSSAPCAIDDERMIARRLKRPVDAAKHAARIMRDVRQLAVHRQGRANDLAAENLADRLMAKAHARASACRRRGAHEVEADAGFVRRARARRQHDGVGCVGHDFGDAEISSLRQTDTSAPNSPRNGRD